MAELPTGWHPVTDPEADQLDAERRREMAPTHLLYGRPVRAIARFAGRDDVLYEATPPGTELYLVHLTWNVERDAEWPWVEVFASLEDFRLWWLAEGGERP